MPNVSEFEQPPRRVLNVFYLLDTSGSMTGAPIAALNNAMGETIEALKAQAKHNADAMVKVAVMQFSSGCSWVTSNGPEELDEDFEWYDLQAGGLTDMGDALTELDKKLSRKAYLDSITGNYLPVIIVMTDGGATDDYAGPLNKIRQNKWFRRATKIGFALGDSPDVKMISEVVGNSEAVIKTSDLTLFGKLLKFASVTASMVASQSQTPDSSVDGAAIVKGIQDSENVSVTLSTPPFVSLAPQADTSSDPDWDDADEDW